MVASDPPAEATTTTTTATVEEKQDANAAVTKTTTEPAQAASTETAPPATSAPETRTQATTKTEDAPAEPVVASTTAPVAETTATPAAGPTQLTLDTATTQLEGVSMCEIPDEDDDVNLVNFKGNVDSNNELPSDATIKKIEDYIVLDKDGKSCTFKSLYAGKHVARRVLIIFVRHFFCGNCQEYLRALSASITPDSLLRLPISTFIAVIGCGDPRLIDMYARETGCPFPIYSDPTRKLYSELGMVRTLALGNRPAYMTKSILRSSLASVVQGLKQVPAGLAHKSGDQKQIGGEFLFEPLDVHSPLPSPVVEKPSTAAMAGAADAVESRGPEIGEEKRVSWCHRMTNTRDHAEIPELMEVLGLDGVGRPIEDQKRWSKALHERKGTGLSMAREISSMKADAEARARAEAEAKAKNAGLTPVAGATSS